MALPVLVGCWLLLVDGDSNLVSIVSTIINHYDVLPTLMNDDRPLWTLYPLSWPIYPPLMAVVIVVAAIFRAAAVWVAW